MTAMQDSVRASSPAWLNTPRGRVVFWLLIIDGVLVFDLFSISERRMVLGKLARGYFVYQSVEYFGDPQRMNFPSNFQVS